MSAILDSDLVSCRLMTHEDLPTIMAIEKIAYPYPWTDGIFQDCLRVGYLCQVMERTADKRIVAYSIVSVAAGESHLLNVCVDRDFQGKGFGREMLVYSLGNARRLNATVCFLEVRASNRTAVALYDAMGFNQIGVRHDYYPSDKGKEDALIYALQL